MEKLLPSFRRSLPSFERGCKCGGQKYVVPNADDVPLVVHGYRPRTGAFRITWCPLLVEEKIKNMEGGIHKNKLRLAYDYLMHNNQNSYKKFVIMQSRGCPTPFLYEVFSTP